MLGPEASTPADMTCSASSTARTSANGLRVWSAYSARPDRSFRPDPIAHETSDRGLTETGDRVRRNTHIDVRLRTPSAPRTSPRPSPSRGTRLPIGAAGIRPAGTVRSLTEGREDELELNRPVDACGRRRDARRVIACPARGPRAGQELVARSPDALGRGRVVEGIDAARLARGNQRRVEAGQALARLDVAEETDHSKARRCASGVPRSPADRRQLFLPVSDN